MAASPSASSPALLLPPAALNAIQASLGLPQRHVDFCGVDPRNIAFSYKTMPSTRGDRAPGLNLCASFGQRASLPNVVFVGRLAFAPKMSTVESKSAEALVNLELDAGRLERAGAPPEVVHATRRIAEGVRALTCGMVRAAARDLRSDALVRAYNAALTRKAFVAHLAALDALVGGGSDAALSDEDLLVALRDGEVFSTCLKTLTANPDYPGPARLLLQGIAPTGPRPDDPRGEPRRVFFQLRADGVVEEVPMSQMRAGQLVAVFGRVSPWAMFSASKRASGLKLYVNQVVLLEQDGASSGAMQPSALPPGFLEAMPRGGEEAVLADLCASHARVSSQPLAPLSPALAGQGGKVSFAASAGRDGRLAVRAYLDGAAVPALVVPCASLVADAEELPPDAAHPGLRKFRLQLGVDDPAWGAPLAEFGRAAWERMLLDLSDAAASAASRDGALDGSLRALLLGLRAEGGGGLDRAAVDAAVRDKLLFPPVGAVTDMRTGAEVQAVVAEARWRTGEDAMGPLRSITTTTTGGAGGEGGVVAPACAEDFPEGARVTCSLALFPWMRAADPAAAAVVAASGRGGDGGGRRPAGAQLGIKVFVNAAYVAAPPLAGAEGGVSGGVKRGGACSPPSSPGTAANKRGRTTFDLEAELGLAAAMAAAAEQ